MNCNGAYPNSSDNFLHYNTNQVFPPPHPISLPIYGNLIRAANQPTQNHSISADRYANFNPMSCSYRLMLEDIIKSNDSYTYFVLPNLMYLLIYTVFDGDMNYYYC